LEETSACPIDMLMRILASIIAGANGTGRATPGWRTTASRVYRYG